ncbi:MAG: acyl-CoA dehydratase activase [Thermodesulfobacteriota bacterium]|jgi:predicted CoA-substrate-specific enzyme activase
MSDDREYYAGVDIGSAFIKAVLINQKQIVSYEILSSRGHYKETARKVLDQVLNKGRVRFDMLSGIVVTGIGAESAPFQARQFSDISCQAAGCRSLFSSARIVIDIGGQFTRAVKLTPQGRVANFLMSEKCATGSGRFLQVIARILRINVEDIGPLSLKSQSPVEFSTNCAVFAESETISRIAEGARMEDILAGVHRALAAKAAVLVKRLGMEQDVVLTGGGGEDSGLVSAVSEALEVDVLVPEQPRLTAALGAATLAKEENDKTH